MEANTTAATYVCDESAKLRIQYLRYLCPFAVRYWIFIRSCLLSKKVKHNGKKAKHTMSTNRVTL